MEIQFLWTNVAGLCEGGDGGIVGVVGYGGEGRKRGRNGCRVMEGKKDSNSSLNVRNKWHQNEPLGVTAALVARDALRSTNGDDSPNSGTGVRRIERANRECTYTDFLKCQPLPFK
nr:hypothetical protein [Tanacetum cinerariifolium]